MDSFAVGQLWVDKSGKLYRIDEISPGEALNSLSIAFSEWDRTHFAPGLEGTAGWLRKKLYRYVGVAWPYVPDEQLTCFSLPVEDVRITPYWKLVESAEPEAEPPSTEVVGLMAALRESLRKR